MAFELIGYDIFKMTPTQKKLIDKIYFSVPKIYVFISSRFEYEGFIHVIFGSIEDGKISEEYVFTLREIDELFDNIKKISSKDIFHFICTDTTEYIKDLLISKSVEYRIAFEIQYHDDSIISTLSEIYIIILSKEMKNLQFHQINRLKFEFILKCYQKRKEIVNSPE